MIEILSLTIPFFTIILLGSIARLGGWFSEESGQMLARFAFFVVLPPFMFIAITAIDVTSVFNIGFVLRYELATIIMFILSAVTVRLLGGLSATEKGLFCLNTAYPNYGYIGVPLAILAFGEQAAIPVSLVLVFDTIVLLVMTTIMSHDARSGRLREALQRTALAMVKNPLLMSVLVGFGFSASGFSLPEMPHRLLEMLAGAAAPAALFALGITLVGQPIRAAIAEISVITCLKLIVHPVLVALLFLSWPASDPIDPMWIKVAILFACLPIAANVFAMSQFYGAYQGRTATTIMLTTILASITVPVTLYVITHFI